jgi:hypothetical protein
MMNDRDLLHVLHPWRPALNVAADELSTLGCPYPNRWWLEPRANFINDAKHHIDAAAAGQHDGVDHLTRAVVALLSAMAIRATGR